MFILLQTGSDSYATEGAKKLHNYQCSKCSTTLRMATFPSSSNCPAGDLHKWNDLGEVGKDVYQCSKCSTLIRSKSFPKVLGCPKGNIHKWNKL